MCMCARARARVCVCDCVSLCRYVCLCDHRLSREKINATAIVGIANGHRPDIEILF